MTDAEFKQKLLQERPVYQRILNQRCNEASSRSNVIAA